ncbi:putative cation transporter, partial [Massariosphaeria phaeospora]
RLHRTLPSLNFITLHYIYFVATCLVTSVVFWASSTPARSISYTDSLFVTVSAMTLAGLNTVNLSTLNTFQQFLLFFLIIIGSAIFVSGFVVHVRKRAFESRLEHIVNLRRRKAESERRPRHGPASLARRLSRSLSRSDARRILSSPAKSQPHQAGDPDEPADGQSDGLEIVQNDHTTALRTEDGANLKHTASLDTYNTPPTHITFGPGTYYHAEPGSPPHSHRRFMSMRGVGAHANASLKRRSTNMSTPASDVPLDENVDLAINHLSFASRGLSSRNSQFHHLSEAEREELGGYEYRAIRLLSWLVPAYSILFQLLGCVGIGAYVAINKPSVARRNGLNPWWVGSFNAVSAFNNSGMSLVDANMIAFQNSVYMLITMGLLILAGNTCYPIFLRLTVWTLLRILPKGERWEDSRRTMQFLLDHPRRCYTNMFPSRHTWWLLTSVVTLNGIDWAAFEILNIGNHAIAALPTGIAVLDGLFQALAVRSGGFYVVPIPSVRISLQVLYVIMMYISVYPVVITMRNSNVYEERSLGIYADDPGYAATQSSSGRSGVFGKLRRTLTNRTFEQTKSYFVRQQLRAQLAHDLWWLVLAVFIIMIIEGSHFETNPAVFSVFNVIFETVSAYGCVGISVGLPDQAYSFSGALHTTSKLVLCVVMLRGRHRGLPVAIDKAILLPGERVDDAEEEDGEIRLERSVSRGR